MLVFNCIHKKFNRNQLNRYNSKISKHILCPSLQTTPISSILVQHISRNETFKHVRTVPDHPSFSHFSVDWYQPTIQNPRSIHLENVCQSRRRTIRVESVAGDVYRRRIPPFARTRRICHSFPVVGFHRRIPGARN